MKYVLVIADGSADDPIPALDGLTPLQYANTPVLDKLAGSGELGTAKTIPDGMQAGSDTAILSILGMDPCVYFAGRAPLEAAATGINLSPGDIAYRCNMLSIEDADIPFEEKKILSHSAGAIDGESSDKLIADLFSTPGFKETAEKAGIKIYPGSSFRHIAVQANISFASCVLTAPHDHLDEPLGKFLPYGSENAEVLKSLIKQSHEILNNHPINEQRRLKGKLPANCIWFWAEGTAVKLPDFAERYGKTGAVISAVPLCQGIGVLVGLEKIHVEGATGELNTNYEGKADAAVNTLDKHDFVIVHVEAPDECTHNGDLEGKLQAIEWIDSRVLSVMLEKLKKKNVDYRMLVISDHRTLTSTRGHDSGLVPYVLYDSRFDAKTGMSFSEAEAESRKTTVPGTGLMDLLFKE
ncbi:MAG: cofactor-independent phosphoglycerate mutase [Oscillospiraceae bacterium]|nr:cofactor-independent phosphoglycerate mutase [Oscillospiraceae bacterium]